MGKHIGWRVYEDRGAWVGAAWDPNAAATKGKRSRGRYMTKRWAKESEAKAWATDMHARFLTRLASAGNAFTAGMADDYHADLTQRGLSRVHLHNVRKVLDGFIKAVPDLAHPRAAIQAKDWLALHADLAPTTRNRMLVMAKALGNWAEKQGRLTKNPLRLLSRAKVPNFLKPQFAIEELRTMVAASSSSYWLRACIMIYAGLRVEEVTLMERHWIDLDGRVLIVRGKGSKERMIPIQSELLTILKGADLPKEGFLFPNANANRWQEFQTFLSDLKISRNDRSPHSTRHCYAGLMTASGVPSILLSAYMGHVDQETTADYSKFAMRYASSVTGWSRGEFRLLPESRT